MNIRSLSYFVLATALLNNSDTVSMIGPLPKVDSIANFNEITRASLIKPLEYIQLVQDFLQINGLTIKTTKDLSPQEACQCLKNAYNSNIIELKNTGKLFGFKKYYKTSSNEIPVISMDISWPNLKRKLIEFLDSKLRNEGNGPDSFGNIPLNCNVGTEIQDIKKELSSLSYDKEITLWHLDAIISEFSIESSDSRSGLSEQQINQLIALCLKTKKEGKSRVFDVSDLTDNDHTFWGIPSLETTIAHCRYQKIISALKEMLKNKTGFQRIMSLLVISTINNKVANTKITFEKNSTAHNSMKHSININPDKNYSLYKKSRSVSLTSEMLAESLMHETSHLYHEIIGFGCHTREEEWLYIFSLLNAPIDLVSEFFPMLLPENMNEMISKITDYLKDKDPNIIRNTLSQTIPEIMFYGFGTLLFNELPNQEDLKIERLISQKDLVAKCFYIRDYLLPKEEEKVINWPWTNTEEMLTIRGSQILLLDDNFYFIEDRQNEQIYCIRNNSKTTSIENYYRFHNVCYPLVGQLPKTLMKFEEPTTQESCEYKASEVECAFDHNFLGDTHICCYNMEHTSHVEQLREEIEKGKVDLKSIKDYHGQIDVGIVEKILEAAESQNINIELDLHCLKAILNSYIENNQLEKIKAFYEYEKRRGWNGRDLHYTFNIITKNWIEKSSNMEFLKIWDYMLSTEEGGEKISESLIMKSSKPKFAQHRGKIINMIFQILEREIKNIKISSIHNVLEQILNQDDEESFERFLQLIQRNDRSLEILKNTYPLDIDYFVKNKKGRYLTKIFQHEKWDSSDTLFLYIYSFMDDYIKDKENEESFKEIWKILCSTEQTEPHIWNYFGQFMSYIYSNYRNDPELAARLMDMFKIFLENNHWTEGGASERNKFLESTTLKYSNIYIDMIFQILEREIKTIEISSTYNVLKQILNQDDEKSFERFLQLIQRNDRSLEILKNNYPLNIDYFVKNKKGRYLTKIFQHEKWDSSGMLSLYIYSFMDNYIEDKENEESFKEIWKILCSTEQMEPHIWHHFGQFMRYNCSYQHTNLELAARLLDMFKIFLENNHWTEGGASERDELLENITIFYNGDICLGEALKIAKEKNVDLHF